MSNSGKCRADRSQGSCVAKDQEAAGTRPADSVDRVLAALARSNFRRRFQLKPAELDYLAERGLGPVMQHARRFLSERLAPALPVNDGRQTPLAGHPVFIAQHATATCCRKCLWKWHRIKRGSELDSEQIDRMLGVIQAWPAGKWPAIAPVANSPAKANSDNSNSLPTANSKVGCLDRLGGLLIPSQVRRNARRCPCCATRS